MAPDCHAPRGAMVETLRLTRLLTLSQQMSPYAVGGQPSPGLQTQQQLFPPPPPPHSQQVFALAQNTQQVQLLACHLCLKAPAEIISRALL